MANIINAVTSGVGGLATTADASGNINIQSNGTTVASFTSSGLNVVGSLTTNGSAINVSGGATTTSSAVDITLTSSSNRVQKVAFTANLKGIILPNATTITTTGTPIFQIVNDGAFPCYVKNNSGVVLFYLPQGLSMQVSLIDNTTADGLWATQYTTMFWGEYIPNTFDTSGNDSSATFNNKTDNQWGLVQGLTSTTALIVWRRGSSIYGVVATNSSGTLSYGTVTLIYNGTTTASTMFSGRVLTSTTALINITRATNNLSVGLTISGTTISVSSQSSTYGNGSANFNGVLAISTDTSDTTSIRVLYATSSTAGVVNTITHQGASAPTLGTASSSITIDTSCGTMVQLTSTTFQLWYSASSSINTRIFTTSGTSSPTLGTAVVNSGIPGSNGTKSIAYSSTETAIWCNGSSGIGVGISYTISGTTVTTQNTSGYTQWTGNLGNALSQVIKVDSTTYYVSGPYGQIQKLKYVPGGNLYLIGSSTPGSLLGGYTYSGHSWHFNYYYLNDHPFCPSPYSTTLAPWMGSGNPSSLGFFAGSTNTGIAVGVATDGTLYTPAALVFKIYS